VIAGTATTFGVLGCVILCMCCAIVFRCMRWCDEKPTQRVVTNPIAVTVLAPEDEDPCDPVPSQTPPEPGPPGD